MFSKKKSLRLLCFSLFTVIFLFCGIPGSVMPADTFIAQALAEPDCSYDYNSDNDVDGRDLYEFSQAFSAGDLSGFASAFGSVFATQCRQFLPCQVVEANQCFETALKTDSDPVLKSFHAVTRILALVGNENINALLTDLGIEEDSRELCNWTAHWSWDEQGDPIFSEDMPSTDMALNVVISVLLPQVEAALAELSGIDATIDDPFIVLCEELVLPDEDCECEDIEVDYGDVALYRAALQGLKAFLLIVDAYNLNVEQTSELLEAMQDDIFVINDYLCDDTSGTSSCLPDFLKLDSDGATLLAQAKPALSAAIDSYIEASAFIRSETDNQDDDLITIARNPDEADEEEAFRQGLLEIQGALSGPVGITGFGSDDALTLDLTYFFDNPAALRNYLPEFKDDNEIICGSFDPELGGILPGFVGDGWADFLGISVPVSGSITVTDAYTQGNIFIKALICGSADISSLPYCPEAESLVLSSPGNYEMKLSTDLDSVCMTAFWDKDSNGGLSPGDMYGVYVNNPVGITSVDCLGPEDIDITLDQTLPGIKGTVTGGTQALANAWIHLYESGCGNYLGTVQADSDGNFIFNTLWTGSVSLYIYDSSLQYPGGWWTGSGVTTDCSLAVSFDTTNGNVSVNISLEAGGTISGTVISEESQQPIIVTDQVSNGISAD